MSTIVTINDRTHEAEHLVRATSQAQALRHITDTMMGVSVASQDDLLRLVGKGVKVQDATAKAGEEAAA